MNNEFSKVVTIKELTENNPTLCLSPLRVFNKCNQCELYKRYLKLNKISKLKCVPHIKTSKEALELQEQKRIILKDLAEINKKLKEEY